MKINVDGNLYMRQFITQEWKVRRSVNKYGRVRSLQEIIELFFMKK